MKTKQAVSMNKGSTDVFWRAAIGHEKCAQQGLAGRASNRSDTTWYREDLQRRGAHFLVVGRAAMNTSVLPKVFA